MAEPTEGPWFVGAEWPGIVAIYHDSVYIGHAETGEDKDWIGPNPIGRERAQANARLMASAPALLRELQHLVRLLEPLERAGALQVPGLATLNGARKAIEEATGE